MKLKYDVRVSGSFDAHFQFKSKKDVFNWLANDFRELQEEHGMLRITIECLPGLIVGDKCRVFGEGVDEFLIKDIRSDGHMYSFLLDHGFYEAVYKCYRVD